MSYQVIARKWRPKSFSGLIGQDHISRTLKNALQNDRLPHALLFTGPRGTGKTSSARILAMSVRCLTSTDFTPCGTCDECQQISGGHSVNVIEIDGASNNGVDAIRELRDSVGYMPSSGKYKIYIIDEVHMLSTSAFNALLKTLEEPPDHAIFVMATTEAHKIPNTILSRCQRFDFRRIPLRQISEHLQTICESEGMKADAQALWMIARQGDGSMRDSQSLLDQVISFSNSQNQGELKLQDVVEILGLTDRGLLTNTLSALVTRDQGAALKVVEQVFASAVDAKVFAQDLLEEIRHLLIVKLNPDHSHHIVDLPQDEVETLKQLGTHLSEEDVHMLFDMALKGANDIPRAQDPRIVLEMLLLRMVAAPRITQLSGISLQAPTTPAPTRVVAPTKESIKKTEVQPAARTTEAPKNMAPVNHAPQTAAAKPASSPDERWLQLVERIKKVNSVFAAKLEHAFVKNLTSSEIELAVPTKMKFLHQQISDPTFSKKLKNYITTFWGLDLAVKISIDGGTTAEATTKTPQAMQEQKQKDNDRAIRDQVENHPLVKSTQSVFKSEIKSIKETT